MEANGGRAEFDGLNGIFDLEETTFGAEGVDATIVFGTGEIHYLDGSWFGCTTTTGGGGGNQSICGGNALDFMVADEGDGKSTMGIFMSERARPDDNG